MEVGLGRRLRLLARDPDRKPAAQILYEALHLWVSNGIHPIDYYGSLMFKKYMTNMHDYVGGRRAAAIREHLNDSSWFFLLDNKLCFHSYFADKPFATPRLLGYSFGSGVFVNTEVISVADRTDFEGALRFLADMSTTGQVFAKPTCGIGGGGTYRFSANTIPTILTVAYNHLVSTDYIYEEAIVQHPGMSKIYPHSVNTLRIDTFRADDGAVYPISALMRMGTGGHYADNASSGGCFVGVDMDSGMLKCYAYTLPKLGGLRFREHPDTGVVFQGFEVPLFAEVVEFVCDVARFVPQRMVGWDVAVSTDGPILVEGNPNYGTRLSEVAYGGYNNNPIYRQIQETYGHVLRQQPDNL